jgi:hypothetical protein
MLECATPAPSISRPTPRGRTPPADRADACGGYRDFRRLLFPLRAIIISAFLIVLAISVVTGFVPDRLWDREISGTALGLVEDAIRALLLTPIVIAIHRFVILGEVTTGYGIDVGAPAFRLFFIWLFALKVLVGLPYELLGVLQTRGYPLWGPRLFFSSC